VGGIISFWRATSFRHDGRHHLVLVGGFARNQHEAPKDLILTALELERSEGAVIADKVGDTACTFLAGLYRAEQAIRRSADPHRDRQTALAMD
jgi:hypothetical protein